eukprot:Skav234250  [mRNA]  locus=scaffold1464:601304:608912:- [translate_table: standard]
MMPLIGQAKISGEKDGVFEYSQKLSQQVLTLEADNVELQDAKKVLDADNQLLKAKVQELQLQCEKLRDTSIYTHQDKEAAILQAREAIQSKQAEIMLARKSTEDVRTHAEALATDNMRLNGICEKLQQERSELQRKVHALEASIKSFQAELNQRAVSEGNSLKMRNALEQRLEDMQPGFVNVAVCHFASLQQKRLSDMANFYRSDVVQLQQLREDLLKERQRCGLATGRGLAAEPRGGAGPTEQSDVLRSRAVATRGGSCYGQAPKSALADLLRARIAELQELHWLPLVAVPGAGNGPGDPCGDPRGDRCGDPVAKTNSRLAGEKSQVEHMATLVHAEKEEAHRRCSALEREHLPKLMAKHQVRPVKASSSDLAGLRNRLAQLEGENTRLKGQLSHAEATRHITTHNRGGGWCSW